MKYQFSQFKDKPIVTVRVGGGKGVVIKSGEANLDPTDGRHAEIIRIYDGVAVRETVRDTAAKKKAGK